MGMTPDKPKRGRPPVEHPRETVSIRVAAEVAAHLRSRNNTSQHVEALVRRSKAWRERG